MCACVGTSKQVEAKPLSPYDAKRERSQTYLTVSGREGEGERAQVKHTQRKGVERARRRGEGGGTPTSEEKETINRTGARVV